MAVCKHHDKVDFLDVMRGISYCTVREEDMKRHERDRKRTEEELEWGISQLATILECKDISKQSRAVIDSYLDHLRSDDVIADDDLAGLLIKDKV